MLEHGGQLQSATTRFGIAAGDWLDLSTGINPQGWPVPAIDPQHWQRLPEAEDGLEAAARAYYQCPQILPTAGSQAAIQALPRLRGHSRVGVLDPDYSEHAHAWRRAGHTVVGLQAADIGRPQADLDVLVLSNPNNPTGGELDPALLRARRAELAGRGGWLVVDEAFRDASPAASLISETDQAGLIVLRSLGKFFGLAGARVGFAAATPDRLDALREWLGPWPLSGPARVVAQQALRDTEWQQCTREYLARESEHLNDLLSQAGLVPSGGCPLFQWLAYNDAANIHEQLARQGVLVRLFTRPPGLRFGLPGDAAGWRRLEAALAQLEVNA
ncbi:L-threonine-O-3-phosphate decarboxylase [Methylohalomonas lacus]|uniref:threonine-phosphate decarboxylase n=1 Tax=Methylohalomonas lacus TaxID=398773 RepID=A0AAE3HKM8_9GAMM|nr:threonine-phosphate decarboxylase CobD [Methylohalomonas lacus]MCS3902692.1 L-threonine-O-3-phosphate decarboxylase [Methylohalomonas lacus]